jgi:oxygen-dependent protoporphyrinogen oxidase
VVVVAQRRVVVIGGGISGLATAYHLVRHGGRHVTVLEATPAPGGRIASATVGGVRVDTGPDALLLRAPAAAELVRDLGLDARLRPPAGGGAYLWSRGRLRPLPAGSMFGVPQRLWPLLRSGVLGPLGFVRAGADLVLPRREPGPDPTLEQLLRPRFGRQVFERLIEPMLGGVHAGRAGRLSATSAVPEVAALVRRSRSLYLALRERPTTPSGPALMTFDGGLGVLVDALRTAVEGSGAGRVVTGARATELSPAPVGTGWRVTGTGFDPLAADDVVLATPAPEAGRLLAPLAPAAAAALDAIPYAGVATVMLAYRRADVPAGRPGTGFLVPPAEGRLLVGCTWTTAKWPHLVAGRPADAPVVIRALVGRDGDQAWTALGDAELVRAVHAELVAAMGLRGEPVDVHVRRMPGAMPQYTVGHGDRLAAVDADLSALPGVHVVGAGYRGVGLAGCLTQAAAVARTVSARTDQEVAVR